MRQAYSGRFSGWLDGAIRTVMEVEGLDADAAKRLIADAEAEGLTTKAFYRRLQDWVAPRVLVDKSPSYALDPAALEKAEADFEGPRYIHLVRHPLAMIDSFERHHMEQVLYLHEHPFDPRAARRAGVDAEPPHDRAFLADGPPSHAGSACATRTSCSDPPGRMEALCAQLGLPFDPGILRPYEGLEDKMVDGVYPESAPMGDPGFLAHGSIDPSARRDARRAGGLGAAGPAHPGARGQPRLRDGRDGGCRAPRQPQLAGSPA